MIDPLSVDHHHTVCLLFSYIPELNTVIEVSGCWWHSHATGCQDCCFDRGQGRPEGEYEKQMEKIAFLQAMGFNVVHKWECEIADLYKNNTDGYADFVNKYYEFSDFSKTVTAEHILEQIKETGDGDGDPYTQYFG